MYLDRMCGVLAVGRGILLGFDQPERFMDAVRALQEAAEAGATWMRGAQFVRSEPGAWVPPGGWTLDVLSLTVTLVVLFVVVVVKWYRRSWQSLGLLAVGWGMLLYSWAEAAKNVPALAGWLGQGGLSLIQIIAGLEINCVLWGVILIVRRAARRQRQTE